MKSYKGVKPDLKSLLNYRYQAKKLSFFQKQVVNSVNSGNRRSHAKGKGMDFDEVRHYQFGDDVRLMHWSLTARLGKPFTKVYKEERERALYFVVDQSSAMAFGTRECFKSVKAAEALALIGFGALSNNEKVGGVIFDDVGYNYYPAKQNSTSLFRMFNSIIDDEKNYQVKAENGLENSLKTLYAKVKSNSVIVVIGDFNNLTDISKNYIKMLTKSNEVINIFCYDPIEKDLPNAGIFTFSDGQQRFDIDCASKKQRQDYLNIFINRQDGIKNFARQYKMSYIELATNDDLFKTINYGIMNNAAR